MMMKAQTKQPSSNSFVEKIDVFLACLTLKSTSKLEFETRESI
jgi:hypothetical protein